MARPKNERLTAKIENSFTRVTELHLKKKKKKWEWLIEKGHFSRENVRSWLTGNKNPSLDNISEIAFLLDIKRPKSLLANTSFDPSRKSSCIRVLILEKCNKLGLEPADVSSKFNIPKTTCCNIMQRGMKPTYRNLVKFTKVCKVKSPLDLIQFKITPDQFL